jgi:hypothetical protein
MEKYLAVEFMNNTGFEMDFADRQRNTKFREIACKNGALFSRDYKTFDISENNRQKLIEYINKYRKAICSGDFVNKSILDNVGVNINNIWKGRIACDLAKSKGFSFIEGHKFTEMGKRDKGKNTFVEKSTAFIIGEYSSDKFYEEYKLNLSLKN